MSTFTDRYKLMYFPSKPAETGTLETNRSGAYPCNLPSVTVKMQVARYSAPANARKMHPVTNLDIDEAR
jgi:hypothetical protein